ncbi:MAG TPA: hypothetical protein VI197_04020 [Polyangiaceae bacterium]
MKLICSGLLAASALLVSSGALAQDKLGQPMDVVLGVERAFGFYTGESSYDPDPGGDWDVDRQGFALGWAHTQQPLPYWAARFSFDIFVIDSLSVGGALGFVSQDNDDDRDDDDGDGRGGFIFAPRVGYFIDFGEYFGFWPRGGFTFYDLDDPDQSQGLLTLEPYFTFAPRDGFGFLFGPVIDLGFTGEVDPDTELREKSFGIAIGMFGWL